MTQKSNRKATAKPDTGIAGGAIIGAREGQEDAWKIGSTRIEGVDGPIQILILADGMGGHVGGAKASNVAVDSAMSVMESSSKPISERLSEALDAANVALADEIRADTSLKGMGCTLIITTVHQNGAIHWISVGDSPMLEVGRRVRRLNANHSLAEKIDREAAEGTRSWEEAKNDPERHVLLSALTGKPLRLVDQGTIKLEGSTALVLASDGIESLSGEEIHEIIIGASSPKDCVEKLLDNVKNMNLPDQDNTSVICAFNGKPTGTLAAVPLKKRGGFSWLNALMLLIGIIAIAAGAAALLFYKFEGAEEVRLTQDEADEISPDEGSGNSSDRVPTVPQSDAERRLINSEEFQTANERASTLQDKDNERPIRPSNSRRPSNRTGSSGTSAGAQSSAPKPAQESANPVPSATEPSLAADKAEAVVEAAKKAAEQENKAAVPGPPSEDAGDDAETKDDTSSIG